jgi:hypothetical protein
LIIICSFVLFLLILMQWPDYLFADLLGARSASYMYDVRNQFCLRTQGTKFSRWSVILNFYHCFMLFFIMLLIKKCRQCSLYSNFYKNTRWRLTLSKLHLKRKVFIVKFENNCMSLSNFCWMLVFYGFISNLMGYFWFFGIFLDCFVIFWYLIGFLVLHDRFF